MDTDTVDSDIISTTCSSSVTSSSDYKCKTLAHASSSDLLFSTSGKQCQYHNQQQQQQKQFQQQQHPQLQQQQQHNQEQQKDWHDYQRQEERQRTLRRDQQEIFVPQFPYQQHQHDCRDAPQNEQQCPSEYYQKEQNQHQNLQAHIQNRQLHQQGQKHEGQDQHQSQRHMPLEQQILHVKQKQQQPHDQQLQENQDIKGQQEIEQAQHCALEIFTSISQHISNAAVDFYMENKESSDFEATCHEPTQVFKSDAKTTPLVYSSSREEIPQQVIYSQALAYSQAPASSNEVLKSVSDYSNAPGAIKQQENIFYRKQEGQDSNLDMQETNANQFEGAQSVQMVDSEDAEMKSIKEVASDIKKIPIPAFSKDLTNNQLAGEVDDKLSSQRSESQESKEADVQIRFEADDDKANDRDTAKAEGEEHTEDEDHYLCLCKADFLDHAHSNVKKYICGGCLAKFISICHLHKHLENHGSGGSYHFDHVSQTAYPKYDTFCSFTQTDNDYLMRQDESGITDDVNSSDEVKSSKADEQNASKSEIWNQKCQTTGKSRKRKQDNPKPTRPRISCQRKSERSKKGKRKSEVKGKDNDYLVTYDHTDGYPKDYHSPGLETIENVSSSNSNIFVQDSDKNQDIDCTEVKQEFFEENETDVVVKPFKKRGRPRKCEGAIKKKFVKRKKVIKSDKKAQGLKLKGGHEDGYNEKDNNESSHCPVIIENLETSELEIYPVHNVSVKHKVRKNAKKHQMCDVCGLPVPKYNYVYHMRRHTGEKPFVCDKCGKAFAHRRFLVKHLLTHAEDKPWKCDLCSAQFCQKSEYSMHMNAHQGNRPHECKVCGMKFLSKAMLNTHQANVHMGITRFECEVCNRRFFKRSSLNVHQATHFEATMKCNFCDRMFKDRAGLKRHERIHTGEKRFRCHVCNHEFIQSTPYWVHMEKRHQMDRDSVKNMLKGIRENNKRFGIRTEINVLPTDVDHLLVTQEKTKTDKTTESLKKNNFEKLEESTKSTNSATEAGSFLPIPAFDQINSGDNTRPQKVYTDIKVPNIYSSNVPDLVTSGSYTSTTSGSYTSTDNSEQLALQQHYRFVVPSQDPATVQTSTCGPGSTSSQETSTASSHSLGLPANLPIPVSLTSLGIPMNSLNHGFIGLNPLQQALDFSSSLPNTGTYTDISSDRVTSQQQ